MPLRAKLLLFLLPLVVGPLLGLGWVAYDRLRANAEITLLREMDTLLEQVVLSEETHRSTALANAKLFAGSSLLKRFLFAPSDERIGFLLLPLLNLFGSYHDAYPAYGDIRLLDPDGRELARFVADSRAEAAPLVGLADYLAALGASDSPALARHVRDAAGEPLLLVGRKLVFVDPTFEDNSIAEPTLRGFLLLAITLDNLRRQIAIGSFGQGGLMMFTDAAGRRLFPRLHQAALQGLTADLPALAHRGGGDAGIKRANLNGDVALLETRELTPNLRLTAVLPEAELNAAGEALGRNVAQIGVATLIAASLLLLAVLHFLLLQPVRRLERGTTAIGAGDLQVRLPVSGRDELAHLARVFNAMASNLEASQREKDAAQQEALANKQLAIDNLRKADQLKDEFLANTSHELRTPLHGIIGLAESLRDGVAGPLPPTADDNLRLIVAAGRRLAALVNDILDFSRLRHRDLRLSLTAVDVRALCGLVLQLLDNLSSPKGLELINDIPEGLPPALADENRLQQIFYNLIGNSIKFTEQGSVRVCAGIDDGLIAVRICDTGRGISPIHHEAVFASFEQIDGGAGRLHGGTGLGLAVTRSLVQALGGRITLDSQLAAGACFTFTLPVAPASCAQATVPAVLVPASLSAPRRAAEAASGLTSVQVEPDIDDEPIASMRGQDELILAVDDDPVNLRVLSNQLELHGFRVRTAADGAAALAWLDSTAGQQTAVVLLDVMMPRMNGFELCRALRERFSSTELPVLFLTARNQERDILRGFSVGGNDYLPKPLARGELLARVRTHATLVEHSRALRALTRELEQRVAERTHELEQAHAEMKQLAMRDGLTGAFNRRYLDEALARYWRQALRQAQPLAALMLDIDFFKQYNDDYGHQQGDRCLQAVATVLMAQARRGGDLVARYGGEEFFVITQNTAAQASVLAERIRAAVAALGLEHRGSKIADHITLSIGVAAVVPQLHQEPAGGAEDLVARADAALYVSKRQGRNRVTLA
jgi:diguanylate cyclase (GGDEF)-like protein